MQNVIQMALKKLQNRQAAEGSAPYSDTFELHKFAHCVYQFKHFLKAS